MAKPLLILPWYFPSEVLVATWVASMHQTLITNDDRVTLIGLFTFIALIVQLLLILIKYVLRDKHFFLNFYSFIIINIILTFLPAIGTPVRILQPFR